MNPKDLRAWLIENLVLEIEHEPGGFYRGPKITVKLSLRNHEYPEDTSKREVITEDYFDLPRVE